MNTKMAEYIMVILKSRINIMWSWGCKNFVALNDGLMWHVQGYLLNGYVKVLYNIATDAFDVYFLNNKKELVKKVEEVYLDNLVDVIDWNVEKDDSFDYDKRVKQQYSISLY
ncbi:hypothetical protein [Prevotella sp. ne3005]|uniref:hypothetical protein n=1 Tax=Prevotella sp. ne3005 TaxID=1761887 RepID=UPI0011135E2E|nr:hypothetical protein [Prevotella sp. ne3005]